MSKIEVTETKTGSRIELSQLRDSKAAIFSKLQDCASGSCTCASDEFKNVQSIEIQDAGDDAIHLEVRTKSGEGIDPSCVEECLAEPGSGSELKQACC